ncbi:MAG: DTW domain-containing protein [Myxococcales bacterium]|nr:DTW domain-containing protein [Myxococcales bacterium]
MRGGFGRVPRCPRCALHVPSCLCAEVEPIATRTRVVIVLHDREATRTSNSGRLVPLTLTEGHLWLRDDATGALPGPWPVAPGGRAVMLYPTAAEVLAPSETPLTLVVPDGNWKQARKMAWRSPELAALPRVRLPPGPPSNFRLRSHPDPARVCTFEAVARALGLLEGEDVQRRLEAVFDTFVERTLFSRGALAAEDVTGGVPGQGPDD